MGKITIVGLGPGDYSLISSGAINVLKNSKHIYFRTKKHPIVDDLIKENIEFEPLDKFYDKEKDFESVYKSISMFIIEKSKNEDITYAVPGHPRVAEKTVSIIEQICREQDIQLEIIPSMSFVDAMFDYLGFDPVSGFKLLDGLNVQNEKIDVNSNTIITQAYDSFVASNIKLKLMEYFEDDHEVYITKGAGIKNLQQKHKVKLYEMDRDIEFDYLTSIFVPKSEIKKYSDIDDLQDIMATLRSENGCPWDKKQTHQSLKNNTIEEVYELIQAIDNDDLDEMIEELGDLLLHIVFHAQIGKENGYFDMKDVTTSICKKLIYRHPHVFKDDNFTEEEYAKKWEELKKQEKGEKSVSEGIKRIPAMLPALIKAEKIQKKASLVGFDWDDINDVYKKIQEEYKEVVDAQAIGNIQYIEEELGDLLFSVVNLSRFLKVNPEEALNKTSQKFIKRFEFVEQSAYNEGKSLSDMTLEEMDSLWDLAKKV